MANEWSEAPFGRGEVFEFLSLYNLERFYGKLEENGLTTMSSLKYVMAEELVEYGLPMGAARDLAASLAAHFDVVGVCVCVCVCGVVDVFLQRKRISQLSFFSAT